MKAKHQRAVFILLCASVMIVGLILIATNFRSNFLYFYTPSELATHSQNTKAAFRLGGLVKKDSITEINNQDLTIEFIVTDYSDEVHVRYTGILPSLFREGQGVVATGRLNTDNIFIASEILAKHDENYMPPKVQRAINSPTDTVTP